MATVQLPFENRVRKIERKHSRMSRGVVYRVSSDGLIVSRPRRYSPRFPLKGLLMMAAAVFVFKAFVYSSLGGITYSENVAELANGTLFEQAGAWIMQADPATMWLVDQANALLKS